MNRKQLENRVQTAAEKLIMKKGYASAVDLFIEMGKLTQKDYEKWRRGEIRFLERVIGMNLAKISFAMKEFRKHCLKKGYKPSLTVYMSWGKKKTNIQFSKSGDPSVEKWYSTHFVKK